MNDKILNIFLDVNVNEYSALDLAYIGDAVFELYARTKVVTCFKSTVGNMSKKTNSFVNATEQSKMYFKILEIATEKEKQILKRGRNSKVKSKAKNAKLMDYKYATSVETLIGYLYLSKNYERLNEIFSFIL